MRCHAPSLAILLASLLAGPRAAADSHSWSGASGSVEVNVWRLGFQEGAGVGGWDEDNARSFATFARRLRSIVPAGARVNIEERIEAAGVRIEIRRRARRPELVANDLDSADLDRIGVLLAAHFGRAVLPEHPPVALYTIQLFASRSKERADRFAERIDDRGVVPSRQFFREACHPCRVPEARVLSPSGDRLSRVVIGVFDRRSEAVGSLRGLRRDWQLTGFVREL